MKRVIVAGGGTGGHLYPGLAVAQVLRARHRGVEIRFLGSERGIEGRVVPREGFELLKLPVRGFPRRGLGGQLRAGVGFVQSLWIALRFFMKWKPQVILGTGGYASAPAVVIGRLLKIPIVLQEQNSVPGAVNRVLSRVADEVHIAFAGARLHFSRRDRLRLTGNPLRPGLFSGNRIEAYRQFGLSPDRQTVLVLGGSRGARTINHAIVDTIDRLPSSLHVQFLVQAGGDDAELVKKNTRNSGFPCVVHPFLQNMDEAYTVADLVVCRAGAMTLSEICACGLPSILVPYPYATHNHQAANAEEMVERGAAVMILDAELDGERLAREVQGLLDDYVRLRRMATNAHGSARYGGAERLAGALASHAIPRAD